METGRRAPNLYKILNLHKALDLHKALNLYNALDFYKALNIRRILLLLNGRSGTRGVSKVRKDKAGRPVLDAEEVTVLLSTNTKGLRILFSKDLYIYLIEED